MFFRGQTQRADLEPTGGIMYPVKISQEVLRASLVQEMSGIPCWTCYLPNLKFDKQKLMDG